MLRLESRMTGNCHVRFGERGRETRRWQHRKVRPSSTPVVTKKPNAWVFPLRVTEVKASDLRDMPACTWRAVVQAGLEELGGEARLGDLYGVLFRHAKVRRARKAGRDWQAQIRRALQVYPDFERVERGRWRLVGVGHG